LPLTPALAFAQNENDYPVHCFAPCAAFSTAYANCIPNAADQNAWFTCIKPLCPGGGHYAEAKKCLDCVGDATNQDTWAGVNEACQLAGAPTTDDKDKDADKEPAPSAAATTGSGGSTSAASAVSAPILAVAGLAAAAIVL
jgi:hypothetical protein